MLCAPPALLAYILAWNSGASHQTVFACRARSLSLHPFPSIAVFKFADENTAKALMAIGDSWDTGEATVVLVIEDEEYMRELVMEILYTAGFKVIAARTAEDGLAIASVEPPDVVLCDVVLPAALGFDIVRKLNENPRTAHVPCILFTGYEDVLSYALGQNIKVLKKPFTTEALVDAVTEAALAANAGSSIVS